MFTQNNPPGEYSCKTQSQQNWRGLERMVEHVV